MSLQISLASPTISGDALYRVLLRFWLWNASIGKLSAAGDSRTPRYQCLHEVTRVSNPHDKAVSERTPRRIKLQPDAINIGQEVRGRSTIFLASLSDMPVFRSQTAFAIDTSRYSELTGKWSAPGIQRRFNVLPRSPRIDLHLRVY